ncbi:hypothetical protein [Hoylesella buccalis]|uniref:hypothetical protein n=1 Tax=Hoylesella buccalis TaxID=28127 RepID=UPI001D084C29|nr:hypothetical protein [Hoylesella buccalis]MCB6902780.1 hypothetical protein [Hoylesella buccalis]
MQIIPFPAHYQSVYTNFDISSFSLISCNGKACKYLPKSYAFVLKIARKWADIRVLILQYAVCQENTNVAHFGRICDESEGCS